MGTIQGFVRKSVWFLIRDSRVLGLYPWLGFRVQRILARQAIWEGSSSVHIGVVLEPY